ncbi:MAG: hypothetical protein H7239_13225 [Flavobacterium sp.]|nr:hypothetical protein [Flavobacterium sp.]
MKTNIFLVLLLVAVSLISCKKEGKAEEKSLTPAPELFTFTLNAIVKEDDDFQIFFKEDNDPQSPFKEENSVWVGVKGNENAQDIELKLPESVYPTQIRFDFGQKEHKEILVNSLKVAFKDKSFTLKGTEFFNFFTPDENFVKVDKTASKILPVKQKNNKFDPMLYSNTDFTTELTKISK